MGRMEKPMFWPADEDRTVHSRTEKELIFVGTVRLLWGFSGLVGPHGVWSLCHRIGFGVCAI